MPVVAWWVAAQPEQVGTRHTPAHERPPVWLIMWLVVWLVVWVWMAATEAAWQDPDSCTALLHPAGVFEQFSAC